MENGVDELHAPEIAIREVGTRQIDIFESRGATVAAMETAPGQRGCDDAGHAHRDIQKRCAAHGTASEFAIVEFTIGEGCAGEIAAVERAFGEGEAGKICTGEVACIERGTGGGTACEDGTDERAGSDFRPDEIDFCEGGICQIQVCEIPSVQFFLFNARAG